MKLLIFVFASISIVGSAYSSELAADFVHHPVELEHAEIVKRQAAATTPPPKEESKNYTSVRTKTGCKLYAAEVVFFKRTAKSGEQSSFDTTEVAVPGPALTAINDGTCGNWSGTIVLNYAEGGPFTPRKGTGGDLSSLKLTFNISYLRPYGWWEVNNLGVEAKGSLVKDGFNEQFNGSVLRSMAMGASKKFSYACGRPPTIYYSMDKEHSTVYGLIFKNLQIQPFEWKRSPGNFTDDVDDCVPFFSIGIWMFLIVAGVLLLVIFFGIGMISSLKTMDRFDDPKGKPLVISAKE